ncbi:RidA family protein [Streptomyces sp. NPDC093509]|uniref:RidA family protein n=1 Tax=Streptomyces sp. NPDC093509 TaxID=3154982 RepID=UPI00344C1EDA
MSFVQHLNPKSAPTPSGTYSQLAITAPQTRVAVFSGQIDMSAPAAESPRGAAEQTRAVFAAIAELLASQGAQPADLIKLTTYIVGRSHLKDFNEVRSGIYAQWFPGGDTPANTLLLVAGLAHEALLVEIEGSFVCP